MVDFKELREVVIDPLIEFADHARKMATELEQFSSETNTHKKILLAAWAGVDAVAAITALAGHSEDYRKTSSQFKEVDNVVINLSRQLKWAKDVLESAVAMAPSIPGTISHNGTITINYGALGPNPTQAAISAAQARAQQVHEYMKKALEVATEADSTAQAQLAQIVAQPTSGQNQAATTSQQGGDPAAKTGTSGTTTQDGSSDPSKQTDTGTETGGETGSGNGTTPQTGDGSTKPGEDGKTPGDQTGKPNPTTPGKQSEMQSIGKLIDGIGELLSGGDGNAPGERSDIQVLGDVLEGIGEALQGDGSGAPAPGDGGTPTPTPGDGEVTLPAPVPGDGSTTPTPGTGDGSTPPADGNTGGDNGSGGNSPAPGDGGTGGNDGTTPAPGGDTGNGGNTPAPGDGNTGGDTGGDAGDGDGDGDGDGGDDTAPVVTPPVGDLNAAQMANAVTIIEVGERLGISEQGQAIALATAMQESSFRNLANDSLPDSLGVPNEGVGSDHDSVGVFQQRPSQGWGTIEECMNVENAATSFYTELQRVDGWENMELSEAAQAVQRSAFPDAYARWEDLSQQILDAHE